VTIAQLEAPLREAFAQGLSVAMLAAAVFLIAGIGTALALRRQAATEPAVAILARRLEPAAVGD
jgi:ABC-type spermidine/putrescine transport system permease subunit II